MELFASKLVTISNKRILGKNCSELFLTGSNLCFGFVPPDENYQMESRFLVPMKEIRAEIEAVSKVSKSLVIKGGEPCLQSLALRSLARSIRNLGMFVALETFGTKPAVLRQLLDEKLVDILTLKVYSPLTEAWLKRMNKSAILGSYRELINDVKQAIKLVSGCKAKVNVRTIVVPSLIYKKSDILAIARTICKIGNCTYELAPFVPVAENKLYASVKEPGKDFMDELRKAVQERYPMLRVK